MSSFDDQIRTLLQSESTVTPSRNLVDVARLRAQRRARKVRNRALAATMGIVLIVAGFLATSLTPTEPASATIPGPGGSVPIAIGHPVGGHGPERPSLDYHNPGSLSGPVLNDFSNNPGYGYEPHFLTASPDKTSLSFQSNLLVNPGDEIVVRAYIDNDSVTAKGDTGVAQGVRARFAFPSGVANGFDVESYVQASGVNRIWDSDVLYNPHTAFSLQFVSGSAKEYSFADPHGVQLPDSVVSRSGSGQLLAFGGDVHPGWRNAVCILLTLRVVKG